MKLSDATWYRFGSPPWAGAPRAELVALVGNVTLPPGRAIDPGLRRRRQRPDLCSV